MKSSTLKNGETSNMMFIGDNGHPVHFTQVSTRIKIPSVPPQLGYNFSYKKQKAKIKYHVSFLVGFFPYIFTKKNYIRLGHLK